MDGIRNNLEGMNFSSVDRDSSSDCIRNGSRIPGGSEHGAYWDWKLLWYGWYCIDPRKLLGGSLQTLGEPCLRIGWTGTTRCLLWKISENACFVVKDFWKCLLCRLFGWKKYNPVGIVTCLQCRRSNFIARNRLRWDPYRNSSRIYSKDVTVRYNYIRSASSWLETMCCYIDV